MIVSIHRSVGHAGSGWPGLGASVHAASGGRHLGGHLGPPDPRACRLAGLAAPAVGHGSSSGTLASESQKTFEFSMQGDPLHLHPPRVTSRPKYCMRIPTLGMYLFSPKHVGDAPPSIVGGQGHLESGHRAPVNLSKTAIQPRPLSIVDCIWLPSNY